MADYTPEVRKVLRAAGWRYDRPGGGDHEIWVHPTTSKHVAVDREILSPHTPNGILQYAGSPKQFRPKTTIDTISMFAVGSGRAHPAASDLSTFSDGAKKLAPETAWVKSIKWSCSPSPAVPIMRLNIRSGMARSLV